MTIQDKTRAAKMLKAALDGDSLKKIGETYGISTSRVSQVILNLAWQVYKKRYKPVIYWGKSGPIFPSGYGNIKEMRKYKGLWLDALSSFEANENA